MSALEEIRVRSNAYEAYGGIKGDRHSAEDVPLLLEALDAVLDLANNYRLLEDQQIFDVITEALEATK